GVGGGVGGGTGGPRVTGGVGGGGGGGGAAAVFFGLVGVFWGLAEPLQLAAGSQLATSNVCFMPRIGAGSAARRALAAIGEPESALLEPLRSRLLAALPDAGD